MKYSRVHKMQDFYLRAETAVRSDQEKIFVMDEKCLYSDFDREICITAGADLEFIHNSSPMNETDRSR